MKMIHLIVVAIIVTFPSFSFAASPASKALTRKQEPGGNPIDTDMAINHPSEYAWKLFFYLNRQAQTGTAGKPDLSKNGITNYDDDMSTVWESWADETGRARS